MDFQLNEPDRKSLALHRLIAATLRARPELFERVRARMPRFVARSQELGSGPYAKRWAELVDQGLDAALAMALDEGEQGQVMRSCTPFAGILGERERQQFIKAWRSSQNEPAGV